MEFKDTKEIWHICEPEVKLTPSAGFYERYDHYWTCIHCKKKYHHVYKNLTVQDNLLIKEVTEI